MSRLKLYSGKRILITGAGGYIGCKLINRLRDYTCHLVACVYNNQEAELVEKIFDAPKSCTYAIVRGDVDVENSWTEWLSEGADIVFHLAAQTSHYLANRSPLDDYRINVTPVVHMARTCEKQSLKPRVVFASSATVVGLPLSLPVDELAVCNPITVYDIHKLAGEHYLKFFASSLGLSTVSLRLANVYGPSLVMSKKDRGIVNLMAAKALMGEDLTIYGRGEWLRDYIYVDDVVEAFLLSGVASHDKVSGQSFNVCSGIGTRFVDVARAIVETATSINGKRSNIVHLDTKTLSPIDERNYVGVYQALENAAGWSPRTELRNGISNMMRAVVDV